MKEIDFLKSIAVKNTAVFCCLFIMTVFASYAQNVGINNQGLDPHSSALLDVTSDTKGFLPPRMTQAQRNAIVNPARGLIIYNLTTNCINYFTGSEWVTLCGSLNLVFALDCSNVSISGTATQGISVSGLSFTVPYLNAEGQSYSTTSVSSVGVLGMTLTLNSGVLNNGTGTLLLTVSGIPQSSGVATFPFSFLSQSCNLSIAVSPSSVVYCTGSPTTVNEVLTLTGRIWMDRNLGATQVATSPTDVSSYGDLYQWGRASDGHQCRNSTLTPILSSTDQPGHGSFIKLPSGDWRSPSNDNLWQGVNGINNPCPSGFRLPTRSEFQAEMEEWSLSPSSAFDSPLKLPFAGKREASGGGFEGLGWQGWYWTSSGILSSDLAYYALINNYGWGFSYPPSSFERVEGMSVRCIKDY